MSVDKRQKKKILAVSSSGGHWVQLKRLSPAFDNCIVCYLTTMKESADQVKPSKCIIVKDANQWDKLGLIRTALQVGWAVVWTRPDVVISTGAAPGFFAILFGKVLGARTVWIDSIANMQTISLAGRWVGRFADSVLTQWPHLAKADGPEYKGSIL